MPLIAFNHVTKKLHGKTIIKDASFSVNEGDICAIIGPSGSGKTTLLRLLIGLYAPTTGSILLNDRELSGYEYKRKIGFAFQEDAIYDELTVVENMQYFGQLFGVKKDVIDKRTDKLLAMVDLKDSKDVLVSELSGGMKQRVDIACSLIHDPDLLIMDEPMVGLDPILRAYMSRIIHHINSMGVTIIMASHLLNEVEHICNRLIMLKKGEIVVQGAPDEIKNMYSVNYEIHLESFPGKYGAVLKAMEKDPNLQSHKNESHKAVIFTSNPLSSLEYLLDVLKKANEKLVDIDVNKPSLNEVFQYFEQ